MIHGLNDDFDAALQHSDRETQPPKLNCEGAPASGPIQGRDIRGHAPRQRLESAALARQAARLAPRARSTAIPLNLKRTR
jgi:hypothetical protein